MSFINKLLQNTRKPKGFWGRFMMFGMNLGHAPLSIWGLSLLKWQPEWSVLDIGCGGVANLVRLMKLCPQGKVYGVDYSRDNFRFSMRHNRKELGHRCFIEQATTDSLPFAADSFDAVTAFETIYFWGEFEKCFNETARVLRPGGHFLICCDGLRTGLLLTLRSNPQPHPSTAFHSPTVLVEVSKFTPTLTSFL